MFNKDSQERASSLLKNYGATHFVVMPDGVTYAAVGQSLFLITESPDVQMGESAAETTLAAIETAKG